MQVSKQLRFSVDATGGWRVEEKRKRMDARLVIRSARGHFVRPSGDAFERSDVALLLGREHGSLVLPGGGSIVSRVSRAQWYGGMLILSDL